MDTTRRPPHFLVTRVDALSQLDPANQKSTLEIQNEAALDADGNRRGKRKAASLSGSEDSNDDDDDDDAMDVDGLKHDGFSNSGALDMSDEMVPMPRVESITVLKEKLHARMAALRRPGAQNGEPGDKDELLEERRKQRAALRENRRRETKERKRAEAEGKKDRRKTKEKEKDSKSKSVSTNVRLFALSEMRLTCDS